ncbi:nucleotidyltransferase family protein [uncultured Methanobrevibacter sp.]|uniref:nucleotidyltransferase family protein n=1 Tax=uncultured Methanobrevibacter sp. TaxID=253161 RepID=UPI00262449AC|nr:nucleotidyltransferase family protein [uncultured Methanobrevibacter sp.]
MSLIQDILKRDKKLFYTDLNGFSENLDTCSEIKLIADFTEYNPLHNGHFHCMNVAKSQVPDALFVAIVPGLFERSGRGIPYILPREFRAKMAINVGADIVVEGPPMGIMGSGQYSLSLAKMFKALNADYIPRGYNEVENFDLIMDRISKGHWIAPKPYKIIDKTANEILLKDKLKEDNYVIASFSNSLSKINFDYKNKFIFVKRIGGVSGTLIRESIIKNNFDDVKKMMPSQTIGILKSQKDNLIYNVRDEKSILNTVNNFDFEQLASLNMFNDKLAENILSNAPFGSVYNLQNHIGRGFSTHFAQRILSILEIPICKTIISEYIENYPSKIRVLGYKNSDVLEKFRKKVNNEIELFH